MAPFKTAEVNLNISTKGSSKINSSNRIVFSSQDIGTARFQFNIKHNGIVLPLNDVEGEIVLLMTGDSKFVDTATIVDAEKGIMEYILTQEQLTHVGNVFAELNLKYTNGSKIGGLEWDFSIERAKLDQVIEPSREFYVATFAELERDIHERASIIEETLDQLEEGVTESVVVQVETAKKDSTGQTHPDIDSRIKAEVGRLNQKQEQTTAALASKANVNEVQNLVKNKAEKTYVDTQIASLGKIELKGVYATLQALQTALPTGTTGVYLILADGFVYYWNGSTWSKGVQFQSTGFAPKSVLPDYLSFAEPDPQNIFNPNSVMDDLRILSDGSMVTDATYFTTDWIPVVNGKTYKIFTSVNTKNVFGYDNNKTRLKQLTASASDNTNLSIDFDGYIRFSVNKNAKFGLQVVDASIYNGSFTPFNYLFSDSITTKPKAKSVGESEIIEGSVQERHVSFFKDGKNLFNKSTRIIGRLVTGSSGNLQVTSEYDTSDYIPVISGQAYTINKVRQFALYNTDKIYVSGVNNSAYGSYTFTPSQDGFLRFSVGTSFVDTAQVELGVQVTEFTPYGHFIEQLAFTTEQQSKIGEIANQSIRKGLITVIKNGENFNLISKFDDTQDIEIRTSRNGSANGGFNFLSTIVGGVQIHSTGDDITPIRTFTTVGANHGYTSLVKVTMVSHGKTVADLGSQWSDGKTVYTLLDVTGNVLTFGCPYTEMNGVVTASRVNPIADLTHVSGATNTEVINVANIESSPQLYPSINNISVKYILDGKEIKDNGNYVGNEVKVIEKYTIMDYKAIIEYARNNIGKNYKTANIDGIIQMSNTFLYRKGLKCTTSHSIKALKKVNLDRCGFLQSVALTPLSGHIRKRFMPSVKAKSGFDFANGVDLDVYASDLIFSSADYKSPSIPPSHYVDWLYDDIGNKKYGFSMGYIIDKTNSKNSDRIKNSPNGWDMRGTKKSYPIVIEGITLESGDYMNFMGFRNYLSPSEVGMATNITKVKDSKDTYIYADFNNLTTGFEVPVDDEIGKSVTILQKENLTVLNDVADDNGVVINSSNGNGIIKVS